MNATARPAGPEYPPETGSAADAPAAERLAAEARAAFLRGDANRARECLVAALELSPGDGELALALGHAEMSADHLEAALAAYWSATLRWPKLAAAHSNHALVLQLLGRAEEASRDALRAVSLDPNDIVGLKVLARIHLHAGQHEAAQGACRLILEQDDGDSEARQMLEEAIIQEAKLAENLSEKKAYRGARPPRNARAPFAAPKPALP